MRKSVFIKHIEQLESEELRKELMILYDKLDLVRTHYALELGTDKDRKKRYDQIKKQIRSKYATKSLKKPRRPRIQKVNKILSEVASRAIFEYEMIDIYLFNTEEALNFMILHNYFSSPLFNTIQNSYTKALDLIAVNRMESDHKERCRSLVLLGRISEELHDQMVQKYDAVFPE